MQDYKRRSNASQDALDKLQKTARYHDEHIRFVDLWWDQCLHEVVAQAGLPADSAPSLASTTSHLLSSMPEFEAHLSQKRQQILDLIVDSIKQLRQGPQMHHDENAALKEQNASLRLQLSVSEQRAALLQERNDQREPQLQDLQDRLAASQRKVDRQKSITLARIEAYASKRPAAAASPTREQSDAKAEVPAITVQSNVESDQALAASNARLLEELGQLQVKLAELQATNDKLRSQLAHLTQSDIEASEPYKQIVSANAHLRGRQEALAAQLPALQGELDQLKEERSKFQADMAQESQQAYEEAVSQLTRSEADLARVRQARDELHSSLQVRKAQDDQKQASARELGELADAQASRIAALEAEVARLTDQTAANDTTGADDGSELSKLQRENASLKAELPVMEAAFSKAHEQSTRKVMELVSMEDRIGRLQAEKAKADQKYFAAMKAKDQLAAEIRALKLQQQKAAELATKLHEAEESCRHKVQNLERQKMLADKAREQLRKEVSTLAESSDRSRLQLETLHGKLAEAVKRAEGKELEVAHALQAKRASLEELERLRKQQEKLVKQEKLALNGDSDQLQVYRTMAMCSVCTVRWKNTTLVSCGHVFCKECVDKRTETRQRRCPSCNKGFGTGDVLAVHL
jgi:E3 ubiquitin-protein ligase BRE1